MIDPKDQKLKQWVSWMKWLDRWGYITAGLSFLLLGMMVFLYSWIAFWTRAPEAFLPAALTLVNDLLLVIILLELFRTIIRFLQTDVITLEPFLNIGIIASIRRILTAGAELAHLTVVTDELFNRYMMDIALNVVVVLVLIIAVFLVRKSPSDPIDAALAERP
jgi:uncharacterized membrane protein (DUF373 family)